MSALVFFLKDNITVSTIFYEENMFVLPVLWPRLGILLLPGSGLKLKVRKKISAI